MKYEMRDDALSLALNCSSFLDRQLMDLKQTVGILVTQQIKSQPFTVPEMHPVLIFFYEFGCMPSNRSSIFPVNFH